MPFSDYKTALVTGAHRGSGQVIAARLGVEERQQQIDVSAIERVGVALQSLIDAGPRREVGASPRRSPR